MQKSHQLLGIAKSMIITLSILALLPILTSVASAETSSTDNFGDGYDFASALDEGLGGEFVYSAVWAYYGGDQWSYVSTAHESLTLETIWCQYNSGMWVYWYSDGYNNGWYEFQWDTYYYYGEQSDYRTTVVHTETKREFINTLLQNTWWDWAQCTVDCR